MKLTFEKYNHVTHSALVNIVNDSARGCVASIFASSEVMAYIQEALENYPRLKAVEDAAKLAEEMEKKASDILSAYKYSGGLTFDYVRRVEIADREYGEYGDRNYDFTAKPGDALAYVYNSWDPHDDVPYVIEKAIWEAEDPIKAVEEQEAREEQERKDKEEAEARAKKAAAIKAAEKLLRAAGRKVV